MNPSHSQRSDSFNSELHPNWIHGTSAREIAYAFTRKSSLYISRKCKVNFESHCFFANITGTILRASHHSHTQPPGTWKSVGKGALMQIISPQCCAKCLLNAHVKWKYIMKDSDDSSQFWFSWPILVLMAFNVYKLLLFLMTRCIPALLSHVGGGMRLFDVEVKCSSINDVLAGHSGTCL